MPVSSHTLPSTASVITLNEADFQLIQKYDRAGPRYTSYPPANHFREDTPATDLLGDCSGNSPLSLYFHLPFCEQLCWFCGCHMQTSRNRNDADGYLDLLERELDVMAPCVGYHRPVVQLHFGGGTPNFMRPDQIDRLSHMIHSRFRFTPEAELSVELDPRHLTAEHAAAFARLGINRASFGVQDCNEEVQKAIHRIQPVETNRQAMAFLRQNGIHHVNIDLIYGLPLQTEAGFDYTLREVLALEPSRFAVFNYAHVPWMRPAQKILERHPLPQGEAKLRLLKQIVETLTSNGFHYIGMDHFARPEDELVRAQQQGTLQRNFQGYSTHGGCDIVAFGVSAISQAGRSYRQNLKEMLSYGKAVREGRPPILRGFLLSREDQLRRRIIMELMCNLGLPYDRIGADLLQGRPFQEVFAQEIRVLRPFADDGLLTIEDDALRITPLGRLFIRNIAMCFDTYLKPGMNAYSRTI